MNNIDELIDNSQDLETNSPEFDKALDRAMNTYERSINKRDRRLELLSVAIRVDSKFLRPAHPNAPIGYIHSN